MHSQFSCLNCNIYTKNARQQAVFECSDCDCIFAEYDSIDAFKAAEQKIGRCLIKGKNYVVVRDKEQLKAISQTGNLMTIDKTNIGIAGLDLLSGVIKLFKL